MKILLPGIAVLYFCAPALTAASPGLSEQAMSLTSPWYKQEHPSEPVVDVIHEVAIAAAQETSQKSLLYRTAAGFIHEKLQGHRDRNPAFAIPPTTAPSGPIDETFRHRLQLAYQFAEEAHLNQELIDHERTPYLVHLLSTAWIVLDEFGVENEDVILLALMHDVLEDHPSVVRLREALVPIVAELKKGGLTLQQQDALNASYKIHFSDVEQARKHIQNRIATAFDETLAQHVSDFAVQDLPVQGFSGVHKLHFHKMDMLYEALLAKPLDIQLLKIADRLDHLRRILTFQHETYRLYYLFHKQFHFWPDFVLRTNGDSLNGQMFQSYLDHLSRLRSDLFPKAYAPLESKIPLLLQNKAFVRTALLELDELLVEAWQLGGHPSLLMMGFEHHRQIRWMISDLNSQNKSLLSAA